MTPGLERLSIHEFARSDVPVDVFLRACAAAGVRSVALLRSNVNAFGVEATAALLQELGIGLTSFSAVGYWTTGRTPEGDSFGPAEILEQLDVAVRLGAPTVVVVSGGLDLRTKDLAACRRRVAEGIERILPEAAKRGLRLAIEPLHPILCPERTVITTFEYALELAELGPPETLGIALDSYHVWFDPRLEELIRRAGPRIFSVHIDDFILPLPANLRRRGLMGEGCIDLAGFRRAVEAAGFEGRYEVEVTNELLAGIPVEEAIGRIVDSYRGFIA